jgi:hypothetical protein
MDIYRENVKVPEVEQANSFALNTYPQASKVIHKQEVIHRSYPQAGGGVGSSSHARKRNPRVLSVARICIILPNKKYTLK